MNQKRFKDILQDDVAAPAGPVMSTSAVQGFDPVMKFKQFEVDDSLFRRFQKGKVKFERWSKYLDMQNESHKAIYEFASKNPGVAIILKNGTTGAMRRINRNGTR